MSRLYRMKGAFFWSVFEGLCPCFFFWEKKKAPFFFWRAFFLGALFLPFVFFSRAPFFFWRAVFVKKSKFFYCFCVFLPLFFLGAVFFSPFSRPFLLFFEKEKKRPFFLKGVFFRCPFFALRFFSRPSFYIAYVCLTLKITKPWENYHV